MLQSAYLVIGPTTMYSYGFLINSTTNEDQDLKSKSAGLWCLSLAWEG